MSDCNCYELMWTREGHHPECRAEDRPMTLAEEAWARASREGNFEIAEFREPDFGLKKRQYIWEMMRHKKNIGDVAKAKAKMNFEDAILRYAEYIQKCREVDSDRVQHEV